MTLLNIRGANGAGKTTVVKRFMELAEFEPVRHNNKVMGYIHQGMMVFVFGPYETPTGGCDNFSSKGIADWVTSTLLEWHNKKFDVLFEGVLISMYGIDRMFRLHEAAGKALHIIELTTTLADCEASINSRRKVRAELKGTPFVPITPTLVADKIKSIKRNSTALKWKGVPVEWLDREQAYVRTMELIGGVKWRS